MAGPAAVGVGSALTNIFANLTPNQFGALFGHMTQSNGARALMMMNTMKMQPASAPAMLSAVESIPGLPAEVTQWLTAAVSDPANFQNDMNFAEAALQRSISSGIINIPGLS